MAAEVEVNSQNPGILLRNQVFDKGWKVYVDNRETVLQKTHTVFQGVKIDAGRHQVRFLFEPSYLTQGRWICLAGLVMAILGLFSASRQKFLK